MCEKAKQEDGNNYRLISHDSICVACGKGIPEGTMICPTCQKQITTEDKKSKRISKWKQ